MRTILCYGDSNTWGANPAGGRHPFEVRWTSVLQNLLGDEYRIIEEGLCGRNTVWEDAIQPGKNGKPYLMPCVMSHSPLDLVIIYLGTNDLKARFNVPAIDVALGIGELIKVVRQANCGIGGKSPEILVICPHEIGENIENVPLGEKYGKASVERSRQLPAYIEPMCREQNCFYLNAAQIVTASELDCLHLEVKEHTKLAKAVAEKVNQIFVK